MNKIVATIGAMMCFLLLSDGGVAQAQAPNPSPVNVLYAASGYAYGNGTYYVALRRSVPQTWGDALEWYGRAQADSFDVGTRPAVGAIAWTGAGYFGQVGYVEAVIGDKVTISEMNFNGNWNRVTTRTAPASSFRYIY